MASEAASWAIIALCNFVSAPAELASAGSCRCQVCLLITLFLRHLFGMNSPLPPAKKRKVATKQRVDLARIQRLENLLLDAVSEGTSLNPLVDLLDAANDAEDPHLLFKSVYALYRVFASIIDIGMLVPTPDSGARVVRTWIWERLNVFTDLLVGLMSDSEKSLRVSAAFQYNSPSIPTKSPRRLQYKSSSLSSGTCRLLCPPARMLRVLLPPLISLFMSLTLIRSSLGFSKALRVRVHRMIGPPNYLMLMSSTSSHQPGSTPTTISGGFSYETPRMSLHLLSPRRPSYTLLAPSFRSTRRTLIPILQKTC